MAFEVDCPECGETMRVRPGLAGKVIRCKHCAASFQDPRSRRAADDDDDVGDVDDYEDHRSPVRSARSPRRASGRARSGLSPAAQFAIAGGGTFLLLGTIGLLMFRSPQQAPPLAPLPMPAAAPQVVNVPPRVTFVPIPAVPNGSAAAPVITMGNPVAPVPPANPQQPAFRPPRNATRRPSQSAPQFVSQAGGVTGGPFDWSQVPKVALTPASISSEDRKRIIDSLGVSDVPEDLQGLSLKRFDVGKMHAPRLLPSANPKILFDDDAGTPTYTLLPLTNEAPRISYKMKAPVQFLDWTPDSGLLAVTARNAPKRVEVWSFTGGGLVASTEAFGNETGNGATLSGAAFVGNGRLALLSGTGRLVVCEFPSLTPLFYVETEGGRGLMSTPGRNVLGVFTGRTVRFFSSETGELMGELPPASGQFGEAFEHGAFSIDGTRLGVVVGKPGPVFLGWDLQKWTWLGSVLLPRPADFPDRIERLGEQLAPRCFHWCGNDFVLYDEFLIDPTRNEVVWRYHTYGCTHIDGSLDHRHWFVADDTLKAAKIPNDDARARLKSAPTLGSPILHPGEPLRLTVQIGNPNLSRKVEQHFTAQLEMAGFKTASRGESAVLSISGAVRSSGHRTEFKRTRNGVTSQESANLYAYDFRVELLNSQKQVLWSRTRESDGRFAPFLFMRTDDTLESAILNHTWSVGEIFLTSITLPSYVFPTSSVEGLSNISLTGKKNYFASTPGEFDPLADAPVVHSPTALKFHQRTKFAMYVPDGKRILTAGEDASAHEFRLWDANGTRMMGSAKPRSEIVSLAASPDSTLAAFATADEKVTLYSVKDKSTSRILTGHKGRAEWLAFSPDSKLLAAGTSEGQVVLWTVRGGTPQPAELAVYSTPVVGLAFVQEGKGLIAATENACEVLSLDKSGEPQPLNMPASGKITTVAASPDGKLLAIGGAAGVFLWNAATLTATQDPLELADVAGVAFSHDSERLLIVRRRGPSVVWQIEERRPVCVLSATAYNLRGQAFSADGKQVVINGGSGASAYDLTTAGMPEEQPPPAAKPAPKPPSPAAF